VHLRLLHAHRDISADAHVRRHHHHCMPVGVGIGFERPKFSSRAMPSP
jgi:hypothetical protein